MDEQKTYQGLIDWLKRTWYGLPESDALEPLIRATYTIEEASLLTGVPFSGRNLEELAEMKQLEPSELKEKLDEMARKGLVFRTVKPDTIRYSLNDSIFVDYRTAFWAGHTDERSKAIAPWANQYYYKGGWDKWEYTHTKPLRVLPIEKTIEDTKEILPYEQVMKVLDQHDFFTVSICPCKHRKNIDPDFEDCKYPTEVCLHFGRLGHYIVENGMGREITREETEEIIRKSAESGLVHGVANMQEGPDTICNCDPCCCSALEAFHKLKHDKGMNESNYLVKTNQETCIGCGLCVKRCPMNAIQLEAAPEAKDRVTVVGDKSLKNKRGQVSTANLDFCIGCGVCAYKCPSGSLVLKRRETIEDPPKDIRDHMKRIMADFAAAEGKIR